MLNDNHIQQGVSIIMSAGNRPDLLNRFFSGFFANNTYEPFELIVLCPGEEASAVISKHSSNAPIYQVEKSFDTPTQAYNYAAEESIYPTLLYTTVEVNYTADILPAALGKLSDPATAAVGVRLDYDPSSLPRGVESAIWHSGINIEWDEKRSLYRPMQNTLFDPEEQDQPVSGYYNAVSGAFLLCRKNDLQAVEGFHEEYYSGWEDIDFCLQLQTALQKKIYCINDQSLQYNLDQYLPEPDCEKEAHNETVFKERFAEKLYHLMQDNLVMEADQEEQPPAGPTRVPAKLRLLFVLPASFNILDKAEQLAKDLLPHGVEAILAVPDQLSLAEISNNIITVIPYAQVLLEDLPYCKGSAPDLVQVTAPDQEVLSFVESLKDKYSSPVIYNQAESENILPELKQPDQSLIIDQNKNELSGPEARLSFNGDRPGQLQLARLINYYHYAVEQHRLHHYTTSNGALNSNLSEPDIPLVVVAYNRPQALARLLKSLKTAIYPEKTDLIISIDHSVDNEEVINLAKEFSWPFGKKEIIIHHQNLGLKKHILKCGDLALDHDGVIILEDDLYAAPTFYDYILQTYRFYHQDQAVAGISLYNHRYNESAHLSFTALDDNYDNYFMQVPSSWGQLWTKAQWQDFKRWYSAYTIDQEQDSSLLPPNVDNWPDTSWKKVCFHYLLEEAKYFVYPRQALATNFGDPGIHMKANAIFQVPLSNRFQHYNFSRLDQSLARYDHYCEIEPACLQHYNPVLKDYNFTVDLYGIKPLSQVNSEYILTAKPAKNPLFTFGRQLLPPEANITGDLTGDHFSLALKEDCEDNNEAKNLNYLNMDNLLYHYNINRFVLERVARTESPLQKSRKRAGELEAENELLKKTLEEEKKRQDEMAREMKNIKNNSKHNEMELSEQAELKSKINSLNSLLEFRKIENQRLQLELKNAQTIKP